MAEDERTTIARDGLQRTKPFTLARAADDGEAGDGLTLEGHAAVFNARTLIDSWEGRFWEEIARGAFKKTFAERTPVLQFDHGRHPLVGSIPIGRLRTAKEDDTGAYVKARLHDNWLIQPVRDAIASESINGMSFRFSVVREEWRGPDGKVLTDPREILKAIYQASSEDDQLLVRTLRELKVPELGPVVFPAYAETDVGVRSGTTVIDLGRLRSDPNERKKLARALWVADATGGQRDDTPPEQETDTPDTAVDAIRRVGEVIAEQLSGLAELLTTGKRAPATEDGPEQRADSTKDIEPAGDGHSNTGQPDADDGDHRSDDTSASAPGHAEEHDEPSSGHSSDTPAPRRMSRTGRRLALAAIEQQHEFQHERTALFGHLFDRDHAADEAPDDDSSKEN